VRKITTQIAATTQTLMQTTRNSRRTGAWLILAELCFVMSVTTGFAQKDKSALSKWNDSVYEELTKAPAKASGRSNPMQSDPDAMEAGAKLFDQHCAECHGDMGQGGRKGPSLLSGQMQQASAGTLFWILTNGVVRRGMPVWSKLPEPQRWQLVTYVKSLTPAPKQQP